MEGNEIKDKMENGRKGEVEGMKGDRREGRKRM